MPEFELWDIHIHSSPESLDAKQSVNQILSHCSIALAGIVLTNHDTFSDQIYHHLEVKYDIKVLMGAEITTNKGHFLVFGLKDPPPAPPVPFTLLVDMVRDLNLACVAAHPLAEEPYGLSEDLRVLNNKPVSIHALEINGKWGQKKTVQALADRWLLPTVGGSDAHKTDQLNTMATLFPGGIDCIDSLVSYIRKGRCRAYPVR